MLTAIYAIAGALLLSGLFVLLSLAANTSKNVDKILELLQK